MSASSTAEADRLVIGIVPEQTYGTTPAVITDTDVVYSMASADNSLNRSSGSFVTDGYVAGMIVNVSGFTEAQNNDEFTVGTVAATKLTLLDKAVATEIAGDTVTVTANELRTLRYTSENFRQQTETTESNEIDPTASVTDIIRTGISAPGDLNGEMSGETYDQVWKRLLRASSWALPVIDIDGATTVSFTAPDQIDDSANGLANYVVNEWVYVSTASGLNNGFYKVATVAAGSITVDQQTITTESAGAAGATTIEQGGSITNGTTCSSLTVEGNFSDLTNDYKRFTGAVPGTATVTIPQAGILTCAFTFVCKSETSSASKLNGTNLAQTTTDVMNTIDDVEIVYESAAGFSITGLTLNLNSNLRERRNVGDASAASVGLGKFNASMTVTVFYDGMTRYAKYLSFTEQPFAFVLFDDEGYGYVFDFPATKYTTGQRPSTGPNTDVIAEYGVGVKKDATEGIMMRLARFGHPAAA